LENQLLYFVYGGSESYRYEAKFSILSALRHLRDDAGISISVITDRPQDFTGWPVRIKPISIAELAGWEGEYKYVHRKKACAILSALHDAKRTVFIDSDTFFLKSPVFLFERMNDGAYLVDEWEACWREAKLRPEFAALCKDLESRNEIPDQDLKLYNSGVCGVYDTDEALMLESIGYIDAWKDHCAKLHTIEQIALSFALKGKKVYEAKDCVRHYFSTKKYFHAMLGLFFSRHGERFRADLIRLSSEVPQSRPYPRVASRLWVKWKAKSFKKSDFRLVRALLYGCLVPRTPYALASRHVWWESALKHIKGGGYELSFRHGNWPDSLPKPLFEQDVSTAVSYIKYKLENDC